jgi:hypothetical protein
MPKISVLTVFKRPGGELLVKRCLEKQTFQDFEWIIVTPVKLVVTIPDKTKVFPDPPKQDGDVWVLNKAYNKAIKESSGELLVSIQDEIWFPPDGLEKFWFHYQDSGKKSCVTTIGDKYLRLDDFGKPEIKSWDDPRRHSNNLSYYECFPNDWELNYASVPRAGMMEIGGFDESFDKYYGWDNVDVSLRLDHFGYKFYLDKANESKSLMQKMPVDWEEKNANAGWQTGNTDTFFCKILEMRKSGKYPFKLDYLKEVN